MISLFMCLCLCVYMCIWMCNCVCVQKKQRQLVFTRSSGCSSERTGGPTGTDFQLNDRPLSDQEVTSPLKLQWYEYLTFISLSLISYKAKVLSLKNQTGIIGLSSALMLLFSIFMFYPTHLDGLLLLFQLAGLQSLYALLIIVKCGIYQQLAT